MTRAFYNEIDPYAAAWLRNLIDAGLIAPGDVDTRSITDVRPDDLAGYTQCHFFAGIGGWSLAARLAGWPDDRPLWTGSCPCQPFSVAGKGGAQADERHLWPVFFGLIRAARPPVVMGEQVAAAVGKDWLDGVCADLEGIGYACGAAVVPACAVDAPHRRDRLWFVADAAIGGDRSSFERGQDVRTEAERSASRTAGSGDSALGDADSPPTHVHAEASASRRAVCEPGLRDGGALADTRLGRRGGTGQGQGELARGAEAVGPGGGDVALSERGGRQGREPDQRHRNAPGSTLPSSEAGSALEHATSWRGGAAGELDRSEYAAGGEPAQRRVGRTAVRAGAWSGSGWILGADGKARRVEPGIRLLAHGVPARVGRLRAYGNAIVPQVAAEVLGAYLDAERAGAVRLEPSLFD